MCQREAFVTYRFTHDGKKNKIFVRVPLLQNNVTKVEVKVLCDRASYFKKLLEFMYLSKCNCVLPVSVLLSSATKYCTMCQQPHVKCRDNIHLSSLHMVLYFLYLMT